MPRSALYSQGLLKIVAQEPENQLHDLLLACVILNK